MKRYSVGTLGTFESEEGRWVPADIAVALYNALHDIRMNNAGSVERKRGWKSALAALENAELGVQLRNGGRS